MTLYRLDVRGVRNLVSVQLRDFNDFNILYGSNGSGKTSFLESVYLLGMGRSFRSSNIRTVINHDRDDCTVFGQIRLANGMTRSVGVSRDKAGDIAIKVDRENVSNRSQLAAVFPLQLIDSESFSLIAGGPQFRRQFMDWGVFHVEHSFMETWRLFQKALKQRNTLLRRHGTIQTPELDSWDNEVHVYGTRVHEARSSYIEQLEPVVIDVLARMSGCPGVFRINYRSGWDRTAPLLDALRGSRTNDLRQGFTHSGPQRAELRFSVDGRLAADVLSRGQQKLVVAALKIAQAELLVRKRGRTCTFLIDDLPAEFDERRQCAVLTLLADIGAQVFLTSIEPNDVAGTWLAANGEKAAMFHVEHGGITRCN